MKNEVEVLVVLLRNTMEGFDPPSDISKETFGPYVDSIEPKYIEIAKNAIADLLSKTKNPFITKEMLDEIANSVFFSYARRNLDSSLHP